MHSTFRLLALVIFLGFSFSAAAWQKELRYENATYESTIHSVQLLPQGNGINDRFAPSVKNINDRSTLVLEFDDLTEDADYYFVRFIHCNADWSQSGMRPGMYVQGYNEFEIQDFDFSSESKINYVHYRFQLPNFKTTGNYLAVVYRDRNKEDIVLSRRFMVYGNSALVGGRVLRSSVVSNRLSHQRIEATVNYGAVRSNDPRRDITVVVRQNQRPDQTKVLQSTFLDETQKVMRYQNLGEENEFYGGNEFRFFDLSTTNSQGRNIANVYFEDNRPVAKLLPDQRRRDGYFQNLDLNGQFYIRDLEGGDGRLSAEYVRTYFSLKVAEQRTGIHLIGAFNDWQKDQNSRMSYNTETGQYEHELLLKQGWYDYMYWSADPLAEQDLERSYFDTENLYEIFVYFRPMGTRGDELIGYGKIDFNSRR